MRRRARRALGRRVCVVNLPLGASPWSPTPHVAAAHGAAGAESLEVEAERALLVYWEN